MGSLDEELGQAAVSLHRRALAAEAELRAALFGTAGDAPAPVRLEGRYRLLERLGRGGQGSVWRAIDERLDREVAVKLTRLRLASVTAHVRALRAEAQALGRMHHPNVVEVFDVGVWSDGGLPGICGDDEVVAWFVMERVDGTTFDRWLAARPRARAEIFAVVRQVAAGLRAAHEVAVIHRDVKPTNILVAADGRARVSDFGLALLEDDGESGLSSLEGSEEVGGTQQAAGPVVGTPLYMAPEQLEGRELDERADQYALAVTLFEALFGQRPHGASDRAALLEAKRRGAPPQPRPRKLTSAAYAALARGLAPQPADRHASVTALVDAVARPRSRAAIVVGLAAAAIPAGLWWIASSPSVECEDASVGAAWDSTARAEVLAALGGPTTFEQTAALRLVERLDEHVAALRSEHASSCAAAPTRHAEQTLQCLRWLDVSLDATLAVLRDSGAERSLDASGLVAGLPSPSRCTVAPERLGTPQPPGNEAEIAPLWRALASAEARMRAGHDAEAVAEAEHAVVLAGPLGDAWNRHAELVLANALEAAGRYEAALARYEAAWERSAASDDVDAARAATGAAWITGLRLRDHERAVGWIRHARARLERVDPPPEVEGNLAAIEAVLAIFTGDLAAAEAGVEAAHAASVEALGDDHPRVQDLRENLALVLALHGRLDEAEALEQEVLAWRERYYGPEHPLVAQSLGNLAFMLNEAGQPRRAEPLVERAVALRRALPGPAHPDLGKSLLTLALTKQALARHEEAVAAMEEAVAIHEQRLGLEDPSTLNVSAMLVELQAQTGRLAEARARLSALEARSAMLLLEDVRPRVLHARATLARHEGDAREAARLFEAAARAQADATTPEPGRAVELFLDAADAALAIGDASAAEDHRRSARVLAQELPPSPRWASRLSP